MRSLSVFLEVSRRLESGELDGSGRCYADEALTPGAATGSANPKRFEEEFSLDEV
jgi:hypothetical protein